jgi:hypothetical protein
MKNVLASVLLLVASAGSVMACSADQGTSDPAKDQKDPTQQPATSNGGTEQQPKTDTAPAPAPTTTVQLAPVVPPIAPKMDKIAPTDVGIEVIWEAQVCDEFVGQRKYGQLDYAEVFTLPGTTTSFIDTTVTSIPNNDTIQFTYRIECKKDGGVSDPSNELSSTGEVPVRRVLISP